MSRRNQTKTTARKSPPKAATKKLAVASKAVTASKVFDQQIPRTLRGDLKKQTVDGYDNFLSRIGLNNQNVLSEGTYTFNLVTRNRILLEAAYRGSWIVGALIDSKADDMTRAGIEVTTEKEVNLDLLFKTMTRLQIWQSLNSNIKWGDLYGGSLAVLQIQGQKLDTPLIPDTVGKGQFLGLSVFDRWQLNPSVSDVIVEGPEMGLPKYYDIVTTPMSSTSSNPVGIVKVHHSRVIRAIGIELPFYQAITEMMWGESCLERLWDRLIAFDNATMSAAQLIDRANLRTIGVDNLRQIIAAGGEAMEGLRGMFDMIRELQVNEGLTLIDKLDTFTTATYTFSGLADILLQIGQQLAGASTIPLVRLFGQSPAGLNSTGDSDIRMYYDGINAKQEARLRRPIDVLLKVLWRSVYGASAPEDMEFSFTPLWQMSAKDKADIAKVNTETILGAYEGGLVEAYTAAQELKEISGDTGVFSNITDEQIKSLELEPPPTANEVLEEGQPPKSGESEKKEVPAKGPDSKEPVKNLDSSYRRLGRWLSGK